jgi:hypothetical protein
MLPLVLACDEIYLGYYSKALGSNTRISRTEDYS